MKPFKTYLEDLGEITITFGRFNPPSIGHGKLFDAVARIASGGDYRIYASQSHDSLKNPLDYVTKISYMREMFPRHARNIHQDTSIKTVFDALVQLYSNGYTRVTLVVGSDRVSEFDKLVNRYNGKELRHGFYEFKGGINVESAGERDPDAEGVEGMSASKLRQAAADNDLEKFEDGMPENFRNTEQLFNDVRRGMNLD